MLSLIAGLRRATSGSIKVFGLDLKKNNIKIKERIGVLHEKPGFLVSSQILLVSLRYSVSLFLFAAVATIIFSAGWLALKFYDLVKTGRTKIAYIYLTIILATILTVTLIIAIK